MFRIDTSTAVSSKPAYPAAGTEKYFQDTDPSGGTIVPAWFLNQIQEEIRKVITDAGLTPDKANDGQLSEAVAILGRNTPYLHVRDEKTSGTDGGTFTAGAWQTRTLNTVKTNTISGASLASNKITLPAGTYYITSKAPAKRVGSNTLKIYNVTGTADLIIGGAGYTQPSNDDVQTSSFVSGRITLSVESEIELRHYAESTIPNTGFGKAAGFGVAEVYAEVEIWKIA